MPAKRRQSKFIKQAPQVKNVVEKDDSLEIAFLSATAEKLGSELIKTSKSGKIEKVAKLLSHTDASLFVNQRDKLGWSALMCACKINHTEAVSLLLNSGADLSACDNNGYSSLMWASYKGHADTVAMLLDSGAAVTIRNVGGWDALMLASLNNKVDVLPLLLSAGADPLARNDSDRTALDIATSPECKGHLQAAVDAAVAKETDRLARIAAEEERVRIEQEAIAEAMEVERQRDAAERAEEARALALQERIAREADMAREAARAKKKAEAEARALEHARILAEKAAAKNRRRMEMGEDYYSEEEAVAADTNTDTDEHRSCVVDTPVGIKASDAGLGEAASHGLESGWAEDGPAVGDGHGGGSAEEDIAKAGGLETATDTC